jgi:hypothetical protein
MKENNNGPNVKTSAVDQEPGKHGFNPGNTGVPNQEVYDEDAKAEQQHEHLKQDTNDESKKIVNEQEQEQVVNDDEAATETGQPAKMAAK